MSFFTILVSSLFLGAGSTFKRSKSNLIRVGARFIKGQLYVTRSKFRHEPNALEVILFTLRSIAALFHSRNSAPESSELEQLAPDGEGSPKSRLSESWENELALFSKYLHVVRCDSKCGEQILSRFLQRYEFAELAHTKPDEVESAMSRLGESHENEAALHSSESELGSLFFPATRHHAYCNHSSPRYQKWKNLRLNTDTTAQPRFLFKPLLSLNQPAIVSTYLVALEFTIHWLKINAISSSTNSRIRTA
jgi:hypothetical protein